MEPNDMLDKDEVNIPTRELAVKDSRGNVVGKAILNKTNEGVTADFSLNLGIEGYFAEYLHQTNSTEVTILNVEMGVPAPTTQEGE